jgi:hypothetical protein
LAHQLLQMEDDITSSTLDWLADEAMMQKTGAEVILHAPAALPAADLERWKDQREAGSAAVLMS